MRVLDPVFNPKGADFSPFGNNPLYFLPFFERFINSVKVLVFYAIKLLVWPVKLAYLYYFNSIPVSPFVNVSMIVALVLFVLLIFLLIRWWKRDRPLFLALAWLLAAFLPFANVFYPVNVIFAERLLYLPSVGFCLFLALIFERIYQVNKKWVKIMAVAVFTLILLAGLGRTYQRNFDWQDGFN